MIVRDLERVDRDACRALFQELVGMHRALYPGAEIGSKFRLKGRIFVAEDEWRVVGYAGLIWHRRVAELEPIVVAQDHRRHGIGLALAERVVKEARDGGAVRILVRPTGRNREAIAFFHSIGFDVLGYVRLQVDFEPRDRRVGERIAGRTFRV